MDNQKHKDLEKLYNFLCKNRTSSFTKIGDRLNIKDKNIPPLISELKLMGLDIDIDSNLVKLCNQIDAYDVAHIINFTKKHAESKEVVYNFISESTNQQAQNNSEDRIYIADFQSQGKGRQAKKWLTPIGQSIALSISHRFSFGLQQLSGLNIAIGVAIMQTLNQFGATDMGLKWPNDVINSKGKIAGILIEATGNSISSRAIIGIGLNWNIRSELFNEVDQPCSNADVSSISRTQFITSLILNVHSLLEEFTKNQLLNIQTMWKQFDIFANKSINIVQGGLIKPALYKGITTRGLLEIEVEKKLETVASGEVSIRATNLLSSTN